MLYLFGWGAQVVIVPFFWVVLYPMTSPEDWVFFDYWINYNVHLGFGLMIFFEFLFNVVEIRKGHFWGMLIFGMVYIGVNAVATFA